LLCLGNTAPLVPLVTGRRVVATVHDLAYTQVPESYSRSFRVIYNTITPFIMQYASAVITVSETAKQIILARYPNAQNHLFVVSNGGVPDNIIPKDKSPCAGPYILYVGSFSKLKNFPTVLQIAQRLLSSNSNLYFLFIGSQRGIFGSANFTVDESLRNRMLFLGQIDDFEVLAQYYKHAELLLFPSLSETSGLPPIEAMNFGCPVVVSDIPALKERCADAAIYCNPYDANDICRKVDDVVRDEKLRRYMSEKGLEHAKQFTWNKSVNGTLNILRSIVT
jgi:glycosyltransferase involved in cell wall biosynthesis